MVTWNLHDKDFLISTFSLEAYSSSPACSSHFRWRQGLVFLKHAHFNK